MKTYNKNSFSYKIRAWIIVFLGILQILNEVWLLIFSENSSLNKELLFWIIFAFVFTLWEIATDFSITNLDGVFVQIINFVISFIYLLTVYEKNKTIFLLILEVAMIISGGVIIYCKNKIK